MLQGRSRLRSMYPTGPSGPCAENLESALAFASPCPPYQQLRETGERITSVANERRRHSFLPVPPFVRLFTPSLSPSAHDFALHANWNMRSEHECRWAVGAEGGERNKMVAADALGWQPPAGSEVVKAWTSRIPCETCGGTGTWSIRFILRILFTSCGLH